MDNHGIIDALQARGITLNGFPASVVGAKERFATVWANTPHGMIRGEWAWPTLRKMVEGGASTLSM